MNNELILIMMVHVLWTAALYVTLTIMRAPKIWNVGVKAGGANPWEEIELKVGVNLSNQFEWPLFFYAVCIIIIAKPTLYEPVYFWLGCVFLFGRFIHSAIQILTENIRLRGVVFSINFLAVLFMWCVLGHSVQQLYT